MRFISFCTALVFAANAAMAQSAEDDATLSIELNAARDDNGGCLLSFLVSNGLADTIEKAVYEVVFFDTSGQVERLTLFDFGTLPADRPRVRQFILPETSCSGLGQVLFNGANTCETPSGPGVCESGLTLTSRTGIEVLG
ncbi:MAG: hypothetical protein AAF665_02420 [Pseudomonadota bacterium]